MGALGALGAPGRLLLCLQLCGERGAGPRPRSLWTRRSRPPDGWAARVAPAQPPAGGGGSEGRRGAALIPAQSGGAPRSLPSCGAVSVSLPTRLLDPSQPHPSPEL